MVASLLLSCYQLGESLVPVIVGATISGAVEHGSTHAIVIWLTVLAADFTLLSFSYRFGARVCVRAEQHTEHRLRMWLTDRVLHPAGGVAYPPGDLLSRASSDAQRVGAYVGMLATTLASSAVLVTSTVLLLRYSPLLGTVIIVGTILLLLVQNRLALVLRRRSSIEQHQQANAAMLAEDLIRGLRVLRGIGAHRNAAARYRSASQDAASASLRAVSSQATLIAVSAVLSGAYLTIIAGVGGWLALSGRLGLGQLVSALGLTRFVISPLRVVASASAAYSRALASAERVRTVLAVGPAVREDGAAVSAAALPDDVVIEFRGTTLATGVSLSVRIRLGSMTGLVCVDPVIAAALPQLLAREHDPAAGQILLGNRPLTKLPLDALRHVVLVCHHDAALLPGTLADNLAALAGENHDAITRANRAAFTDDVLETVPDGAATRVGDRGELLSGGQRQRIVLARALAADPAVLVLHDPTTAVDAVTEDGIAERVRALRTHRTTLVITTSPAWLSRCDEVLFLDPHDTLVRRDAHTALLADHPGYRDAVIR